MASLKVLYSLAVSTTNTGKEGRAWTDLGAAIAIKAMAIATTVLFINTARLAVSVFSHVGEFIFLFPLFTSPSVHQFVYETLACTIGAAVYV